MQKESPDSTIYDHIEQSPSIIPIQFYKIILNHYLPGYTNPRWNFSKLKEIFFDFASNTDIALIEYYFSVKVTHDAQTHFTNFIYMIIEKGGSLPLIKASCELSRHSPPLRICEISAKYGRLDCLQFAHESGYPWDPYTTYSAAIGDHIECLEYAHVHGCPWDENTTYGAAVNYSLTCLKYAIDHDCPIAKEIYGFVDCMDDQGNVIDYDTYGQILSNPCETCCSYGGLYVKAYSRQSGYKWGANMCNIAAGFGHLHCLKSAHENGYPWDKQTTNIAHRSGHVVCFKYAVDEGCPTDVEMDTL